MKIYFILNFIILTILNADNLDFSKEEKEYINLNTVSVAMIPNLYPFNMIEHNQLETISYDILQLISKKSGLLFTYENKDWFTNLNPNPINKYKIPLNVLSNQDLKDYVEKNRSNKNIFFKNTIENVNKSERIDYFSLNLSFDNFDLIISPLLSFQASILQNHYANKDKLNKLKIDQLSKDDIQFGINQNDYLLYSIIEKSFNSITEDEWKSLTKKWKGKENEKVVKNKNILNENEFFYLKNKKDLKVCSQDNLAPIEFWDNSSIKGISVDVLNLINKDLNLKLFYKKINSFSQALEYINNKKCDLILSNDTSFSTNETIKKTIPIFSFDLAIITKKNIPVVSSLNSILDKTIAIKKESIFKDIIKEKYPLTTIIETKNDYESLKMVTQEKAYFTLSPHIIASYYLSKFAINDLYISRYTSIPYLINMSVHSDNYILLNILNKYLAAIKKDEKDKILNKWTKQPIKEAFNYSFFLYLFLFILFIITIIIYRQRILNNYNQKLENRIKEEIIKNEIHTKQIIQQSKLAQMGELINMIAHQWRQPLTSISAVTNNLLLKLYYEKKITKKEYIKELTSIIDYSKYMSNTIEDFQNLYSNNKIKEVITLEFIVNKALSIIKSDFKNKNIKIKKNFYAKVEIETYPRELNQVILNLLKNAEDIFYTRKILNPKVFISTYIKEESIYLSIEDNAGGVEKGNIDNIFNPYFSTKEETESSGLGLYMSKIIIEDNCNGKLSIVNSKKGAKFIISLKIKKAL